jgi:hypothetical protein
MTATRVMPCRGRGARSTTRPSEPSDRHCTDCSRGRFEKTPTVLSRFWRPALWPLSYARVAGEIGIEPMAPVLQTGALRIPELLAEGGPGRSRTDRLRIANAVLSRTELQAQSPAAIAGRRVFNYARTGVNSPERPMRTSSKSNSISHEMNKARIGPRQIESNESSPCLRNSEDVNNVGASVPPLRAGHGNMKARVDCGNADPPCVSALLCR